MDRRDHHTKSKSERESQIPYDITCGIKNMTQMGLIRDIENRLLVAKGEGEEGWIGSVGLADTNWYI